MFIGFFYSLREHGVPVSPTEFMDFLAVVKHQSEKVHKLSSAELYRFGRISLIKDTRHFDAYDLAFAKTFTDVLSDDGEFKRLLQQWLAAGKKKDNSDSLKRRAPLFTHDELLRELSRRLKEQKKRHEGGSRWVGTGGMSPFGNSGYNQAGIRIGGESQGRSGLVVAGERRFQDYRTDQGLGVRQLKMCLKKLRLFRKEGLKELSVAETVEETCRQGGEITPVMQSPRRNQLRVLLLCDVGGSMTPHSELVTRMFSACHQVSHFKEFKAYYFHNCIYDSLYFDAKMRDGITYEQLFKKFGRDTRVIILGDAAMAPYELFEMHGGLLSLYQQPELFLKDAGDLFSKGQGASGKDRLVNMKRYFPWMVWLNPDPEEYWDSVTTVRSIRSLIPMFYLSVDGLESAIRRLLSRSAR